MYEQRLRRLEARLHPKDEGLPVFVDSQEEADQLLAAGKISPRSIIFIDDIRDEDEPEPKLEGDEP